jgi:hypothetical protein
VLQTEPRLDCCSGRGEADLQNVCTPCHVFCSPAIMLTNICEQKCGKCGYKTEYDGGEDVLLRKCWFKSQLHGSYKICLTGSCFLYKTIPQLVEGVHWYRTWVLHPMAAYKRTGTSGVELMALQSVYKHFLEACMDFECLWALDYRDVRRSQCARPGSTREAASSTYQQFPVHNWSSSSSMRSNASSRRPRQRADRADDHFPAQRPSHHQCS